MATETPQHFSYSRQRGPYLRAIAPFLLLLTFEGGLFLTMILLFVQNLPLRLGLAVAFGALLLFSLFGVLLRPLRTHHSLTSATLLLRRGGWWLEVPRASIVSARPVQERLAAGLVGMGYDARRQRVDTAFSEEGQIVLELDEPRVLRGKVRGLGAVRQIRCNADRREELLAALVGENPPRRRAPEGDSGTTTSGPAAEEPVGSHAAPSRVARTDGTAEPAARHPPARSPQAMERAPLPAALEARGLTRRFGDRLVVDTLDLRIEPGEVYGFLGPNGAGKTTTIKMLVGLLEPGGGAVFAGGADVWGEPLRAKGVFGYVPDRAHLYEQLTGREFLELIAQLRALPRGESEARIAGLLALLQLEEAAEALCATYSFGMKRKLALAAALVHRPRVLILDEPFNGLDPRSARRLKELLVGLAREGCAIFLSTHDLATAEAVCTRFGVLHRGRLVAEGRSAAELRAHPRAKEEAGSDGIADLEAVFLQLTEEGAAELSQRGAA